MGKNKRSQAQLNFDMAAHGWALCDEALLQSKIERCKELSKALLLSDSRHLTIIAMTSNLEERMKNGLRG